MSFQNPKQRYSMINRKKLAALLGPTRKERKDTLDLQHSRLLLCWDQCKPFIALLELT
jgi:hypothetical protein